jgi:hypothetical protein
MESNITYTNSSHKYWVELGIQTYNIKKTHGDIHMFMSHRYGTSHPITHKTGYMFKVLQNILDRLVFNDLYKISGSNINIKKDLSDIDIPLTHMFYDGIARDLQIGHVSTFNSIYSIYKSQKLKKVTQYEKDIIVAFYDDLLAFINRLSSDEKLTKNVDHGNDLKKEISRLQKFYSKLSCVLDLELIQAPEQSAI